LVLAESENTNFTKIGGTKNVQIPAATPVHNDPPLKYFSKVKFIESVEFFGNPAS
jgi:hypothetical protein